MRWQGREESQNVDDRRRSGMGGGVAIGGGGLLILILLAVVFGVDPQQLLNDAGVVQQNAPAEDGPPDPEEERLASFTKIIFHDTELVWDELFRRMGKRYEPPTLVLFSGQVSSACGVASAQVGPFYCGRDGDVYIDLAFYRDMERQLNAPGEFARAYVLAHEVGHHVQSLLGYTEIANRGGRMVDRRGQQQSSVRLELQADFLAGVWAHHAQAKFDYLDRDDLATAMNAAFQIGDDRLQKKSQGRVVPDAFTHGTSEQRMRWFRKGFDEGDVRQANLLFELDYDDL